MSKDAKKEPSRVSRRIECLRIGKKDLRPGIYTNERALDDKGSATNLSRGFNPYYDTGAFYKK
jgi:hypothetical protein